MSQENVELFRRATEAFNDGDLDTFLAFFDDEVVAAPRLAPIEGGYRGQMPGATRSRRSLGSAELP